MGGCPVVGVTGFHTGSKGRNGNLQLGSGGGIERFSNIIRLIKEEVEFFASVSRFPGKREFTVAIVYGIQPGSTHTLLIPPRLTAPTVFIYCLRLLLGEPVGFVICAHTYFYIISATELLLTCCRSRRIYSFEIACFAR